MSANSSSLEALEELWRVWGDTCSKLTDADWSRPTRCGDWTVQALTAHVSSGVGGLEALVTKRLVDAPAMITTAADLIKAVKPSADVAEELAAKVARSARDDADQATPQELLARFAAGIALCEGLDFDLSAVADYFGRGHATVEAAVDLRVVEATVHLFDLQSALGVELSAPKDGIDITRCFLVDLTPPVDFIEAATGRRPVDFFPVHS